MSSLYLLRQQPTWLSLRNVNVSSLNLALVLKKNHFYEPLDDVFNLSFSFPFKNSRIFKIYYTLHFCAKKLKNKDTTNIWMASRKKEMLLLKLSDGFLSLNQYQRQQLSCQQWDIWSQVNFDPRATAATDLQNRCSSWKYTFYSWWVS